MTDTVKLSVIIPVYNVRDYLEKCIQSVVGQEYPSMEIILVDDGSTDGSDALADALADAYPCVRAVHKPNGGLGSARNAGLDIARGEYVTFLDSDDWWVPGCLGSIMERTEATGADITMFGYSRVFANRTEPVAPYTAERVFATPDEVLAASRAMIRPVPEAGLPQLSMSVCFAIFRRELLAHRFLSEREIGSEDLLFKTEAMLKAAKVVYVPVDMYRYLMREGSLSHSFAFDKFQRYKTLTQHLRKLYSPTASPDAADACMLYIMSVLIHAMYHADLTTRQKREYIRRMAADPVWRSLKISTAGMPLKDKLVLALLRHGMGRTLWLVSETFYRIRK